MSGDKIAPRDPATELAHPRSPPEDESAVRVIQRRLGARIRALRAARHLTQEVVAERIALSQKYLSELERGEKSPSWETLVAIAHQGFEIRLASLVFGIDEDVGAEVQELSDVLASQPKEARRDLLRAMELILRAGEERGSAPARAESDRAGAAADAARARRRLRPR